MEGLTLAIDIAQGKEVADLNSRVLKGTDLTVKRVSEPVTKPCYQCGKMSHDQIDCPFRNANCGNLQIDVCRAKGGTGSRYHY